MPIKNAPESILSEGEQGEPLSVDRVRQLASATDDHFSEAISFSVKYVTDLEACEICFSISPGAEFTAKEVEDYMAGWLEATVHPVQYYTGTVSCRAGAFILLPKTK